MSTAAALGPGVRFPAAVALPWAVQPRSGYRREGRGAPGWRGTEQAAEPDPAQSHREFLQPGQGRGSPAGPFTRAALLLAEPGFNQLAAVGLSFLFFPLLAAAG